MTNAWQSNENVGDLQRRLKQSEYTSLEYQRQTETLTSTIHNSGNELQRLQADLLRYKEALEGQQEKYEALLRENKQISGKFQRNISLWCYIQRIIFITFEEIFKFQRLFLVRSWSK